MPDSQGNDITLVGVPVTGFVALAPFGTAIPTPAAGGVAGFVLPVEYRKLGLLKTDGGPGWSYERSGDALEFWQEGYSLPSGLANVAVAATAAEQNAWVRQIKSGKIPDANGYITFDGGGHGTPYVLFSEEIFKNGMIRRRIAPNVTVDSVTEDRNTRGEVVGDALSFKVNRSALVNNEHFGEWVLAPNSVTKKAGWNVTVTGAPTGGTYTLSLNGVPTAPIAYNALAAAVATALNGLSGVTGVSGITASGTSPIAITFPAAVALSGSSALTGGTAPSVTVA